MHGKHTIWTEGNGFTLVELLVVVAIAAIFLSIAVPSFSELVRDMRAANAMTRLGADLQLAKSEAIKRNMRVLVCSSSNGTSCANGSSWEAGWLVCYDADSDSSCDAATSTLPNPIRANGALQQLTLAGPSNAFWFTPSGAMFSVTGGAQSYSLNSGQHRLAIQPGGSIGKL